MSNLVTVDDLHEIVDALSVALDAKNSYTCGHSERVADISLILAKSLQLSVSEQQRIHIGAHLHDIGKIGIPDAILNKPGRLTKDEFNIIKRHPEIGSNIVKKMRVFRPVIDIVRHHHERIDGKGYPDGLKGRQISLGARIVAVADAFDAMTTLRPYRIARSLSETIEEMKNCRGNQFDSEVVDILILLLEKDMLQNSFNFYREIGG